MTHKKKRIKSKKKNEVKKQSLITYILLKLKTYLFTGVLVTAPVTITFYMAYVLFVKIDEWSRSLFPPQMQTHEIIPYIPGIGVFILVVTLIVIGMFTTGYVGRFFVRLGDYMVSRMPLISSIYSLLKQLFETVLSPKSQSFKEAVLIEYPRKGIWIVGFLSTEVKGELAKKIPEKNMLSIFVPTTPNPTSGFLVMLPDDEVIRLKMSVEDALKYTVSCGIVEPIEKKKLQTK